MIYADPPHVVETPYGCLHAMHPDNHSWTTFTGQINPPGQHSPVTATVFLDGLHGHAGTASWYPNGPNQRVDLTAADPLAIPLRNAVNDYLQTPSGGQLMTQRLTRLLSTVDGLQRSDRDGPEVRTLLLRQLVPWMTTDPEIREIAHGLADGWKTSRQN